MFTSGTAARRAPNCLFRSIQHGISPCCGRFSDDQLYFELYFELYIVENTGCGYRLWGRNVPRLRRSADGARATRSPPRTAAMNTLGAEFLIC